MSAHPVRKPLIVQLVGVNVVALMVWLLVVNLLMQNMTAPLLNALVVVLIAVQLGSSIWVVVNGTKKR